MQKIDEKSLNSEKLTLYKLFMVLKNNKFNPNIFYDMDLKPKTM